MVGNLCLENKTYVNNVKKDCGGDGICVSDFSTNLQTTKSVWKLENSWTFIAIKGTTRGDHIKKMPHSKFDQGQHYESNQ